MKTIVIAALIAASVATLPAAGQPAATRGVGYADLDLATPRGRATLELRLLHAASAACGTPSPADPHGPARQAACIATARAQAASQRDAAIAIAVRRGGSALAGR